MRFSISEEDWTFYSLALRLSVWEFNTLFSWTQIMSLKKFWNSVAGFYLVTRKMKAVMFLAMLSTSSLLSKNCNTKSLLQKRLFAQSKEKGTKMELSRNPWNCFFNFVWPMLFLIHVKAFHGKPRDLVIADYRYLCFRFSFQISDESCHLRFADHFLCDFRQVSIYKLNWVEEIYYILKLTLLSAIHLLQYLGIVHSLSIFKTIWWLESF